MIPPVRALLRYAIPPPKGKVAFQPDGRPHLEKNVSLRRNFEYALYQHEVVNARGREQMYSLDSNGLAFVKSETECTFTGDCPEDERIKAQYYPECEAIIKELVDADVEICVFDHKIRKQSPIAPANEAQPVLSVHIDQTASSATKLAWQLHSRPDSGLRLDEFHSTEAGQPPWSRIQIVNLWRPIRNAAWSWPLALCDYRSVDECDLIPTRLGLSGNEMYGLKNSQRHKWCYMRGMEVDECVVFTNFDSIDDKDVAKWVPHTSFDDPTTPTDAPYRESIEVRAMLYYPL